MYKQIISLIFLVSCFISATALASHHEAEAVIEATRDHNGTANRGEWKEHYAYYALGCTGFYEAGMVRTNKQTQRNIENQITGSTRWNENGGERRVFLRHPEVAVHGDVAVVTCYQHGWYRPDGDSDRENVLNRVSLVWKKTDDGWKIVHEHYSEMKKDF